MQRNHLTVPKDLQDKYKRYQRIQYQKMAHRTKLTRTISNAAALCAIALIGLAATSQKSTQKDLIIGSLGMAVIASGAQLAQTLNNRHTKNEVNRIRQSFLMNLDRA